jgi:subtilisin
MDIKKLVPIMAIIATFFVAHFAYASNDDNRYLIKSSANIWKKSFSVRNVFDTGFTADLNDWQLRLTKILGIEIEPVKKLNILETASAKAKPVRSVPTENVPWYVKFAYGDQEINKSSGGKDVIVAILDTGIAKHPDLSTKVCKDFTLSKPLTDGKCDDKNGHGTGVAGVIGANGGSDGKGLWGMAPEVSLHIYKVCSSDGSCWADDIASAIKVATDDGANIINLGLGSDIKSNLVAGAVSYAVERGVLIVVAAGNDGPYVGGVDYPAADPNVLSVGAIETIEKVPEWSARGTNSKTKAYVREEGDIDFAGPGVNIESTAKGGDYAISSGTSMAGAYVTGLAAKVWQSDKEKPALETKELLYKFAEDILPPGDDDASGWGVPKL